jgi:hypothetical protein
MPTFIMTVAPAVGMAFFLSILEGSYLLETNCKNAKGSDTRPYNQALRNIMWSTVLYRLVVRVHLAQNNTLWSNVEYSHHKVYAFPFVWCAVYIHFAAKHNTAVCSDLAKLRAKVLKWCTY